MLPEDTIADVIDRNAGSPAAILLQWGLSTLDKGKRYLLLEEALQWAFNALIRARAELAKKKVSEDLLSEIIVMQLSAMGVAARHDTKDGGHVDIYVDGPIGTSFLWVGEAKIWNGPAYVLGGFLQLSTRYAVAIDGRDQGGIVIYCWENNALQRLKDWQAHLLAEHPEVEVSEDIGEVGLFFRTTHPCPNSGRPFQVRHEIIPLHFDPKK